MSNEADLLKNLDPELTDTQKLFVAVTAINTALNDTQVMVNKHHRILVEGNGEIPLTQRVRDLESFIGGIRTLGRILIGAVIVQTISFAYAAIWYALRLYPVLVKLADQKP